MTTVLVVEDNPANMKLTTLLLTSAGHNVLPAVDAETGLRVARDELPDLILMDIQLPSMDRLAIKADEERSQSAGCDAYIVKPLRDKELYTIMERLLTQRRPAKRQAASRDLSPP